MFSADTCFLASATVLWVFFNTQRVPRLTCTWRRFLGFSRYGMMHLLVNGKLLLLKRHSR